MLYLLNLMVCLLLFMLIVWPLFYKKFKITDYIIFYGVICLVGSIEFYLAFKLKDTKLFYPILILIVFWGLLFLGNLVK